MEDSALEIARRLRAEWSAERQKTPTLGNEGNEIDEESPSVPVESGRLVPSLGTTLTPGEGERPPECRATDAHGDGRSGLPPSDPPSPPDGWLARARAYTTEAEAALWGARDSHARDWLHRRGLTDETIRAARLGCQPEERDDPRADWGLPDDGKQVWLPRGIVVPWLDGGQVREIKIRRPNDLPKYVPLRGSGRDLYVAGVLGHGRIVVAVEGELDALLLAQDCGDLVAAVALGSVSASPSGRAIERLLEAQALLVIHGSDEPGEQAPSPWAALGARSTVLTLPVGTDVIEMHRRDGDVRAWLTGALESLGLISLAEPPGAASSDPTAPTSGGLLSPGPVQIRRSDLDARARTQRRPRTDRPVAMDDAAGHQRAAPEALRHVGFQAAQRDEGRRVIETMNLSAKEIQEGARCAGDQPS